MKKFVILFAFFVAAALIGCGGGGGGSVATNPLGPVVTDTGTGTGTNTGTGTDTSTGTGTGTGTDVSASYILAYDGAKIATYATYVMDGPHERLTFDATNNPIGQRYSDGAFVNFQTNQILHGGNGIGNNGFEIFDNKFLVSESTTGLIYSVNGGTKSIYSGTKDNFAATIDNSLIMAATYFSVHDLIKIGTRLYISNGPSSMAYIDENSDRVRVVNLPGRYYDGMCAVDGEVYLLNEIWAHADKYSLFKYNNGNPIDTGFSDASPIYGAVSYKNGLLIAGRFKIFYYADGVSSTWLDSSKIGGTSNGSFNIFKSPNNEIYITNENRNIYKIAP